MKNAILKCFRLIRAAFLQMFNILNVLSRFWITGSNSFGDIMDWAQFPQFISNYNKTRAWETSQAALCARIWFVCNTHFPNCGHANLRFLLLKHCSHHCQESKEHVQLHAWLFKACFGMWYTNMIAPTKSRSQLMRVYVVSEVTMENCVRPFVGKLYGDELQRFMYSNVHITGVAKWTKHNQGLQVECVARCL